MYGQLGIEELLEELRQNKTIEKIKTWIKEEACKSNKFHCPFCDKKVTVYKRPIHKEMGEFLMQLYSKDRVYSRFYTMRELYPDSNKAASDGSYLVHWGLIDKSDKFDQAPPNAYRLTDKGRAFVAGQLLIPSHCHMLNNEVIGWSDHLIHVREVIENYENLLYR